AKRVGELDEEMVYESRIGDTFTLGSSTWRIVDITPNSVLVLPAPGLPGRLPFWHGDSPGRPAELGAAIGQAQAVVDTPDRTQAQVLAAAGVVQDALAQVVARGDTRPLRALAGFARNLKQSDFTPGTWSAVATALTAADTVLAAPEPAADAVDAAYAGLRDAIGGLALRANKTALETALALATAVLARADQYAPASVAGLAEAAAVASAVFADDDATQTAVDAAVGDVVTRVAAARLKPAPPAAASVAGGADQASAGTAAVAKASKASKASAKAAVTLARRSVKAGAKAKVTVRLKAAGGAVPTGKVVLKVAGKSKTVVFKARHQGERTVTLPAVSKSGVYKVKVAYKGSASVAKASVAAKTLRVK
ncbi:MAG: FIVAR domain-containing protein, partial [Bifidobacteriaceae bacterium]|nr:FIVAR domain-containing protein [Bifidobacteriaceae bacterium]